MRYYVTMTVAGGLLLPALAIAQTSAAPLSEGHARSAMMDFGCNNISSLSAGPEGSWHGQCYKGGAPVNVMMDASGKVTAGGRPSHISEPMARSALLNAGCSNIAGLSAGPENSWHGQCYKGGAPVNVMVDNKGAVSTGQKTAHLTEAHARSILTGEGCSNISGLNSGPDGSWTGQCSKSGKLSNVSVDSKGAVMVR